jgi:hypothetical protein
MTELSEYALEPLREGPDFTLYRGREHDNSSPVLLVAIAAEQPSSQGLRRLEHEYSLAHANSILGRLAGFGLTVGTPTGVVNERWNRS